LLFAEAAWTIPWACDDYEARRTLCCTHCFLDSTGQNVVTWLTASNNVFVPAFPDRQQIVTGGIQIG